MRSALRPGGDAGGRTCPDSRSLQEPQPWYGAASPISLSYLLSAEPGLHHAPSSRGSPSPILHFCPLHPTPITDVAGARQDLGDIAPLTVVWQQCLLENIAARGIQDRAVPLGPALRLSISDKLCGLSAKGCAAPCPASPARADWHPPGRRGEPQGNAEGQRRSPGAQPSRVREEGVAAWTKRGFLLPRACSL